MTHLPAEQNSPDLQDFPQAPQLTRSLIKGRQIPEQSVWPFGQIHLPPAQDLPPEQAFPQLPQLLLLDFGSTQTPEQLLCPAEQEMTQEPEEQT
jgi:hypothetical protein